jgi:hypothetical protein
MEALMVQRRLTATRVLPCGRWTDVLCCLAVVVLAVVLSSQAWTAPVLWDPDGLAYQAKMLEYSGVPKPAALSRAFELRRFVTAENAGQTLRSESLQKFDSDMRWFRRRILVSEVASWLRPVLGDERSLLAVSIAAYVLLGAALYILVRFRFAWPYALAVASAAMLFPPLRRWSLAPMSDSAGVLSIAIALIAATLTIRSGRRWLPLWIAALALGSFTRESIAVAVVAAAVLAVRRVPNGAVLFATGVAAVAPAAMLFRYPMRLSFANLAARRLSVPVDTSTIAIVKHWAILVAVEPLYYLASEPIWTTVLLVTVVIALLSRGSGSDRYFAQAAAVGGLAYLVTFPFISGLRLELVLLPAAALGAAALAGDLVATVRPAIDAQPRRVDARSVT